MELFRNQERKPPGDGEGGGRNFRLEKEFALGGQKSGEDEKEDGDEKNGLEEAETGSPHAVSPAESSLMDQPGKKPAQQAHGDGHEEKEEGKSDDRRQGFVPQPAFEPFRRAGVSVAGPEKAEDDRQKRKNLRDQSLDQAVDHRGGDEDQKDDVQDIHGLSS